MTDFDWKPYYSSVSIAPSSALTEMMEADRHISEAVHRSIYEGFRQQQLDMVLGPRFGPPRVLNDERQAALDRVRELRWLLEDVALEWGIDLHEGCDW